MKNRTSELVKLGFSARHYGLTTIVITQQLTSIAKSYRENISKLVTFNIQSEEDMNVIFKNFIPMLDKSEKKEIFSKLRTNEYARLEILRRSPYTYKVVIH